MPPQDNNEANHMLFISDLQRDVEPPKLHMIFGKFQGFREVRQVKERGVAFVEYDTIDQARVAKAEIGRQGIAEELGQKIKINFAKK